MSVVRPARAGEPGKPWKVIDEYTGLIIAECSTKDNADKFRRIRDNKLRHKKRITGELK